MIPLPLYLAIHQSDLMVVYDEYRLAMAEYLGYGPDTSLWTGEQISELDRRMQEAYRYICYPPIVGDDATPHVWSWLLQRSTVTTVSATQAYDLPANVGSIIGDLTYPAGSVRSRIVYTSEHDILERSSYTSRSGPPQRFAVRWKTQVVGLRQRQEILFWPIPDGAYVLSYRFAVDPGRITASNPFPLGGARIAQLYLEACRAFGWAARYGKRGDMWDLFMERLTEAVQLDKRTLVDPTVGVLGPSTPSHEMYWNPADNAVTYVS